MATGTRTRKPKTTPEPYLPIPGEVPTVIDADPQDSQEGTQDSQGEAIEGQNVQSISPSTEIAPRPISGDSTASRDPGGHDDASMKAVYEANANVRKAEGVIDRIKRELKNAKADYEAAVAILMRATTPTREPMPLFDDKPKADDATTSVADDSEKWRTWPLARMGDISEKALEAFGEKGLHTLGAVADWQASGNKLEDLDGIGPSKAEKIADALAEVHRDRPWDVVHDDIDDDLDDDWGDDSDDE